MIDLAAWIATLLVLTGVIETSNGYAAWFAGGIIFLAAAKTVLTFGQGFILSRRMGRSGPIDDTPMGDTVTHIRTKQEFQDWLETPPEGDTK